MYRSTLLVVLGLAQICWQIRTASCYNILAVFPVRAYSHFVVLNSIAKELASHGHNVTVYSKYPEKYKSDNYTHIELVDCFPLKNDNYKYNSVEYVSSYNSNLGFLIYILSFIPAYEEIKECEPLMDLIETSDHSYDLLLLEAYNGNTDIYAGLSYKLKIPYVSVATTTLYPWLSERIATPDNPSYIPVPFSGFTSKMTFYERIVNTVVYLTSKILYNLKSITESDAVARQLFGQDMPNLRNILENCSLTFTYTHSSMNPIRPLVPNVVEIAGVNIKGVNPLPEDIEKFINESEHGVLYFSMGSFLHSKMFPKDKLNALIAVFAQIPQRVIWKWESDTISVKTDKIYTASWLPQKDILAHPNVKLFMSHGGLLGLNEAIYAGVPILGIPIFADQLTNVNHLKNLGAAEVLDYNEITEENVLKKIYQILDNISYEENAKLISTRYKDRPLSPQDTVVYWSEYVVRHDGAHHLRTPAARMPWYQYILLDVIGFVAILFAIFFITVFYTFKLWFLMIRKLFVKNWLNPAVKVKEN
ncbi:UDP-glycosyltransferase UGT5-like [Planococcus citri]|uniref:UDP-glycosyltransferase UGT5-like n=1 Tax=Planococcus citri TaxID=170843 RepID=UPI0031F8CCA8